MKFAQPALMYGDNVPKPRKCSNAEMRHGQI